MLVSMLGRGVQVVKTLPAPVHLHLGRGSIYPYLRWILRPILRRSVCERNCYALVEGGNPRGSRQRNAPGGASGPGFR